LKTVQWEAGDQLPRGISKGFYPIGSMFGEGCREWNVQRSIGCEGSWAWNNDETRLWESGLVRLRNNDIQNLVKKSTLIINFGKNVARNRLDDTLRELLFCL